MRSLKVNQESLPVSFEENLTVHDALENLLQDKVSEQHVVTGIFIDGEKLDEAREEELLGRSISDIESLEIESEDSVEVALEAIDTATDHAEAILPVVRFAANDLKEGKVESGEEQFILALDALDLFVNLIQSVCNTLGVSADLQINENDTLQMLESHLLNTVKKMLEVRENEDMVGLAALLEQDLVENMQKWKNEALPKLKSINVT